AYRSLSVDGRGKPHSVTLASDASCVVRLLQRPSHGPRDADEILRLESFDGYVGARDGSVVAPSTHGHPGVAAAVVVILRPDCLGHLIAAVPRVAVAKVEPQRSFRLEHPPHLSEHRDHLGDIRLRRSLQPD